MVGRDAVEPGAKLAFPLESAESGDGLDQHFLRDFLGILRVEDHADGDVVDPRLMPQNQLFQGLTAAVLGLLDQVGICRFIDDLGKGIVHRRIPRSEHLILL